MEQWACFWHARFSADTPVSSVEYSTDVQWVENYLFLTLHTRSQEDI